MVRGTTDGRGAGLFTFAPLDAYVGEMRSLGYSDDIPLGAPSFETKVKLLEEIDAYTRA